MYFVQIVLIPNIDHHICLPVLILLQSLAGLGQFCPCPVTVTL